MDTNTAVAVIGGALSTAGIVIAAIVKSNASASVLRDLSKTMDKMNLWLPEMNKNVNCIRVDCTHMRDKIDSDHEQLKSISLHENDHGIQLHNLTKEVDAIHSRLDRVYENHKSKVG